MYEKRKKINEAFDKLKYIEFYMKLFNNAHIGFA